MRMLFPKALLLPIIFLGLAGDIRAQQVGDAERGKMLAKQHCARCHVLPGESNFGIGSTPSFKLMVRSRSPEWHEKFELFYTLIPHPNFVRIAELPPLNDLPPIVAPIEISLWDVDHLLAYVDELAAEFRKQPN